MVKNNKMGADRVVDYIYILPFMILPQQIKDLSEDGVKWETDTISSEKTGINYRKIYGKTNNKYKATINIFPNADLVKNLEYLNLLQKGVMGISLVPSHSVYYISFNMLNDTMTIYSNGNILEYDTNTSFNIRDGVENKKIVIAFKDRICLPSPISDQVLKLLKKMG